MRFSWDQLYGQKWQMSREIRSISILCTGNIRLQPIICMISSEDLYFRDSNYFTQERSQWSKSFLGTRQRMGICRIADNYKGTSSRIMSTRNILFPFIKKWQQNCFPYSLQMVSGMPAFLILPAIQILR